MATPQMNKSWEKVRAQIEEIWSEVEFTDAEMKKARGKMRVMVRLIHHKTNEPEHSIFDKISAII